MSATQHTPGPWRFEGEPDSLVIIGRPTRPCRRNGRDGDWSIATVEGLEFDNFGSEDETYANASLIAAAPDMLEALQNISGFLDTPVSRRRNDGDEFYGAVVESLRAAIAKAEGRS